MKLFNGPGQICEHLLADKSGQEKATVLCERCLNKTRVTLLLRGFLIATALGILGGVLLRVCKGVMH